MPGVAGCREARRRRSRRRRGRARPGRRRRSSARRRSCRAPPSSGAGTRSRRNGSRRELARDRLAVRRHGVAETRRHRIGAGSAADVVAGRIPFADDEVGAVAAAHDVAAGCRRRSGRARRGRGGCRRRRALRGVSPNGVPARRSRPSVPRTGIAAAAPRSAERDADPRVAWKGAGRAAESAQAPPLHGAAAAAGAPSVVAVELGSLSASSNEGADGKGSSGCGRTQAPARLQPSRRVEATRASAVVVRQGGTYSPTRSAAPTRGEREMLAATVAASGRPGRPSPSSPATLRSAAPERKTSGEGRIRTGDTTVFSRVLYQLSYLARRVAV